MSAAGAPPPPPPPPTISMPLMASATAPRPPSVSVEGPPGAYRLELAIFNGAPFKDHWAYYIRSRVTPNKGVLIHATGDVMNGFDIEFRRYYDLDATTRAVASNTLLHWIDGKHIDEPAMLNHEIQKDDDSPCCGFEASLFKIRPPQKSLNSISDDKTAGGKKITQRNCQTWIIKATEQLVRDKIVPYEVLLYVRAKEQ